MGRWSFFRTGFYFMGMYWLQAACHTPSLPAEKPEHHLAMVVQPGAVLYVDRVDSRSFIKVKPVAEPKSEFRAFLVGWRDSTAASDPKRASKKEKYFQYDMQKDWVAVIKGDSVFPVFFQEKPELDGRLKEGIMVFEVPVGERPDTLIYKDSYGSWGTRLFALNQK